MWRTGEAPLKGNGRGQTNPPPLLVNREGGKKATLVYLTSGRVLERTSLREVDQTVPGRRDRNLGSKRHEAPAKDGKVGRGISAAGPKAGG